jgi:hypothetical protein
MHSQAPGERDGAKSICEEMVLKAFPSSWKTSNYTPKKSGIASRKYLGEPETYNQQSKSMTFSKASRKRGSMLTTPTDDSLPETHSQSGREESLCLEAPAVPLPSQMHHPWDLCLHLPDP